MIRKFSNYEEIDVNAGSGLAPGGYVLRVINARVENTRNGHEVLKICFDIGEGEKQNFFYRRFEALKKKDAGAVWPISGTASIFIPTDDGSEKDETITKPGFKRFVTCVEESNEGYRWNWDEASLKGKWLGAVFGKVENQNKTTGEIRAYVQYRWPCSVDRIRAGDFDIPELKPLKKASASPLPAVSTRFAANPVGDISEFEEILGSSDGNCPF